MSILATSNLVNVVFTEDYCPFFHVPLSTYPVGNKPDPEWMTKRIIPAGSTAIAIVDPELTKDIFAPVQLHHLYASIVSGAVGGTYSTMQSESQSGVVPERAGYLHGRNSLMVPNLRWYKLQTLKTGKVQSIDFDRFAMKRGYGSAWTRMRDGFFPGDGSIMKFTSPVTLEEARKHSDLTIRRFGTYNFYSPLDEVKTKSGKNFYYVVAVGEGKVKVVPLFPRRGYDGWTDAGQFILSRKAADLSVEILATHEDENVREIAAAAFRNELDEIESIADWEHFRVRMNPMFQSFESSRKALFTGLNEIMDKIPRNRQAKFVDVLALLKQLEKSKLLG